MAGTRGSGGNFAAALLILSAERAAKVQARPFELDEITVGVFFVDEDDAE